MDEIPITKASPKELKKKPASGTQLGFGKIFTDYLFLMEYKKARVGIIPGSSLTGPLPWTPPPWFSTTARRYLKG